MVQKVVWGFIVVWFIRYIKTFPKPSDFRPRINLINLSDRFSLQTETPNRKLLWPIEAFSTSSPKSTGIRGCSEFCTRYFVEYSAATVYLLSYPVYHLISPVGHFSVLPTLNG
jgi:hypothetical protein